MAAITQQEQKTRVTAALLTMVVGGVVLLALLLRIGGNLPGPPGAEMGMEVNLGYDNVGYGDVQPDAPVGNDKPQPQEEQSSPAPSPPQEEASKPAEAQPEEPEPVATSDAESPVEINEKKKDVKPVEKAPEKPKEKPKEKPAPEQPKEAPKEVKKEPVREVKKDPTPDNNAIFKPGGSTTAKTGDATGKEGKPGNHGDDPGTVGDKGNPNGTPDAKALYGKPGGGEGGSGPALELNGWEWDDVPKPNIPNNETGRIVFEIEVDDNGELLGYKKISGGLSAGAERACVAALQKLTFSKKSGAKVPPISKGKITFVVRSE